MLHPALLTLVAWLAPQEPASPPSESTFVIRLAGGPVLRTRAREVDGRLEIRRDGQWIELPRQSIERATSEADLLRESRRLERAAGNDPALGAAHAQWCLEQGLVAEGLERLDRILARDPDQEQACSVLQRARPSLGIPGLDEAADPVRLRGFVARAAGGGPALREIGAQELADPAREAHVRPVLLEALQDGSPRTRSFAALALRRLGPGENVRALLDRAVLDASEDVRAEAARALRDVQDPSVIAPLVRAMGSKRAGVRLNAIGSLAHMGYPAAVEPLYGRLLDLQGTGGTRSGTPRASLFVGRQFAYVQDYDVEVSQNASIADPIINVGIEGAALGGAVLSVQEYVVQTERAALRSALERLTGASPGRTTEAWTRWWNDHGNEWLALANQERGPSYPSSRER
jgi:hypothetical protein